MAIGRTKSLDEQKVFELWSELGSLTKVQNALGNNPNTGKLYWRPALWRAAALWILKNPEDTRAQIAEDDARREFDPMTDEEWNEWIVRKAKTVWKQSPKMLEEWLTKNELHDTYKALFG